MTTTITIVAAGTATMTTERRSSFDKAAATSWLLAIVAGLGIGVAARMYAAPAPPSTRLEPRAIADEVPTVVLVRRPADRPVARTRAS